MTIQAQTDTNGQHESPRPDLRVVGEQFGSDHFVAWALAWRKAGYPPLILGGHNGKKLLVKHITGHSPSDATVKEIRSWPTAFKKSKNVNLGIRCPLGVVGIDVDAYDGKRGLTTLAEREAAWGALPPTYMTTARDDGSGIRWFRVPVAWTGHDPVSADGSPSHVELIQRHHRYAAVPPSEHAHGSDYRLYGRDGDEITPGILPPPSELPELPKRWLDGLASTTKAQGGRINGAEVAGWLDEWNADDYPNYLAQVITWLRSELDKGTDRHTAMFSALCWALKEARAGAYPARTAHDELKTQWDKMIHDPDAGRHDDAEFDRMVRDGIAAADADDHAKRWLRMHRNYGEDTRDNPDVNGLLDRVETVSERRATVRLSDVAPTAVKWLWKCWLPLGKLSILEGESDVGKSTLTLAWASIVSKGKRWPPSIVDGKPLVSQDNPAGVVLVGIEDGNSDTVVPRLIAAGADLDRVYALNRPVDCNGNPKPFTIPDDIDWLRQAICEAQAKLVVIDPITACLPEDAKHGVDGSIRRILMSLVDLAAETESAIVMIRHFNKAQGMSAKNRGGGSVAYSALVRSVLSVGKLTESQDSGATFAIARAIGNLSKQPESIGYRLDDAPKLFTLPKSEDADLGVAVVKWCGAVNIDADGLVGADGAKLGDSRKTAPVREDAETAIKELLKDGRPMKMNEVVADTIKIAGCSKATVKLAAKKIGVIKRSVYVDGKIDHWTWELQQTVIKMNQYKD